MVRPVAGRPNIQVASRKFVWLFRDNNRWTRPINTLGKDTDCVTRDKCEEHCIHARTECSPTTVRATAALGNLVAQQNDLTLFDMRYKSLYRTRVCKARDRAIDLHCRYCLQCINLVRLPEDL